jgi:hypothetical protein
MERVAPLYHKTDVLGLKTCLREKFTLWAGNGSCVEEIWKSCKDIVLVFEGIKRFVSHKILSKNPDPEYYNREVERLKVKVRRVYNKRKHYQEELKRLSKELLVARRKAQGSFLRSVLQNEGRCWAEFFKYAKRRKGNREIIPAIKGYSDNLITGPTEKSNSLHSYFASVFSCERSKPQIRSTDQANPFNININTIRKRLSAIGRKKSVGPVVFLGRF